MPQCPGREYSTCPNAGQDRYCGFCGNCWLDLDDDERQAAIGKDAAPPEIHEHHTHVTKIYPRRSLWWAVLTGVASGAAGVLLMRAAGW